MIPEPAQLGASADAFTREVIRNKLLAIAGEMGIVLARTSMSPIVYEVLDFACGITDATAQVIALENVMRDDVARPSMPREAALGNAPQREGPMLRVPVILEEGR